MENHLLIVAGGTGGKIVRAYKKLVYQQFRNDSPKNIEYLYIDSSRDEWNKDSEWEVLGDSIALGNSNFLELQSQGLAEKFQEIEQYPGVKEFIGEKQQWIDLMNNAQGQKTAGMQRRRMGRILFASNASNFNKALADRVQKLRQETNQTDVTFHVCAGLAGGTGSGSIIDIITQIRNQFPASNNSFRILLYVYLPEDVSNWNTPLDFYHANGYAALTELNALSTGALKPFDVTGEKGQLDVQTPFTGCYVFTNQNENGVTVDKETELPAIVADFLYQKTVALKVITSELERLENGENGDPSPEMLKGSKVGERSKRFLSFGIKRIAIPEQEIKEYLTFNLARQAALQLRFNNWTDAAGFVEEPRNMGFNEYVQQKDKLQGWHLTLNHLMLSEPVLIDESSKRWKKFENHWNDKIDFFKPLALEKDKKEWVDALKMLISREFDEDFRKSGGVNRFFEAKRKDKRDMAREIRKRIEAEFFGEWRNGDLSISDLSRKLNALLDFLRTDVTRQINEKIESYHRLEEKAKADVRELDKEWAQMGVIGKWFGKRSELFDTQRLALQDEYIIRTQLRGAQFAREFMPEILEQLELFNQELTQAGATINEGILLFEKNINSRCEDADWITQPEQIQKDVFKQQLIPFYESTQVKQSVRFFNHDSKIQNQQTAKVREAITKVLGEDRMNFADFNSRLSKHAFATELEKVCLQNALILEKDQSKQDRLLGMSVIEKLQRHYQDNTQELRSLVGQLMRFAGCYVEFNPNEVTKAGDGFSTGAVSRTLLIILPQNSTAQYPQFVEQLKQAFEFNKDSQVSLKFLEADANEYQITLMTITSLFPLRYLSSTDRLREKYQLRLQKSDGEKARMLLHLQNDSGKLPKLFAATQQEREGELLDQQKRAIPQLLLGYAMGKIKLTKNEDGYTKLALIELNRFDDEEPVVWMDPSLPKAWKSLSSDELDKLNVSIDQEVKVNFRHKEKKAELVTNIVKTMKGLQAEHAGTPEYKLLSDAGKQLIETLEKEA